MYGEWDEILLRIEHEQGKEAADRFRNLIEMDETYRESGCHEIARFTGANQH